MADSHLSRRDFVSTSALAALGASVAPRPALGATPRAAPGDRLDIAVVGCGGQGSNDALELVDENLVAFCDIDFGYVEDKIEERAEERNRERREKGRRLRDQFQRATRYTDFRVMLDEHTDLDAVVVSTPDHLHAPVAKAAMEAGKHVYVQKPLTWSVHEARVLAETAERTGVVTQMGNQGHSSDEARLVNEWIQAGLIGPVRQVLAWTNRPIWPQGIQRPLPPDPSEPPDPEWPSSWNRGTIAEAAARAMGREYPVPDGLDWDLYLGPVPEDIPYHPVYHPFNWRGWVDFGVGALGDMGAHLLDHPVWALDLGYPDSVEATSTPWGSGSGGGPDTYPLAMTAHYEFPARGMQPPVRLSWYDGGLMPPRPAGLPDEVEFVREGGVLYVGEWGFLVHETYGRNPRLFPEELMEEAATVPQRYERIEEEHQVNWARACKGMGSPTSPFAYAARLTEIMLLGLVALRAGQGRKILYDARNMRVVNVPEANRFLTREYREGWEV